MPCCPACLVEHPPGTERCPACEIDLGERPEEAPAEGEGPPPGPLVTVATFDLSLTATLLARRLEAEGIECFIADAETVGAYNLLSGAVGGVKVQVR